MSVDDPLALLLAGATVDGAEGRGLICRPGELVIIPPPAGGQVPQLAAIENEPAAALLASGQAERMLRSDELHDIAYKLKRGQEHATLKTATGDVVLGWRMVKGSAPFLARGLQRAFGFRRLPISQPGGDVLFGIHVAGVAPERPCGLLSRDDGLWLFEVPPLSRSARVTNSLKTAGDVALMLTVAAINAEPSGTMVDNSSAGPGVTGPARRHLEGHLKALRKGRLTPAAPAEIGPAAGPVTAALLDEREPGDIRVELTIGGRTVELTSPREAEARARLRHIIAGTLGPAARGVR